MCDNVGGTAAVAFDTLSDGVSHSCTALDAQLPPPVDVVMIVLEVHAHGDLLVGWSLLVAYAALFSLASVWWWCVVWRKDCVLPHV